MAGFELTPEELARVRGFVDSAASAVGRGAAAVSEKVSADPGLLNPANWPGSAARGLLDLTNADISAKPDAVGTDKINQKNLQYLAPEGELDAQLQRDLQTRFNLKADLPAAPGIDMSLAEVPEQAARAALGAVKKRQAGLMEAQTSLDAEELEVTRLANDEARALKAEEIQMADQASRWRADEMREIADAQKSARQKITRMAKYVDSALSPDEYDRLERQTTDPDPVVREKAKKALQSSRSSGGGGDTALTILAALVSLKNPNAGAVIQGFLNKKVASRESQLDRNAAGYQRAFNELEFFQKEFNDLGLARQAYKVSLLEDMKLKQDALVLKYGPDFKALEMARARQALDQAHSKELVTFDQMLAAGKSDTAQLKLKIQMETAPAFSSPLSREAAQWKIENQGWAEASPMDVTKQRTVEEIAGGVTNALTAAERVSQKMDAWTGTTPSAEEIRNVASDIELMMLTTSKAMGGGTIDAGLLRVFNKVLPIGIDLSRWLSENMTEFATSLDKAKLKGFYDHVRGLGRAKLGSMDVVYSPELMIRKEIGRPQLGTK